MPAADYTRGKPHRSPESMAKSGPIFCGTAQKSHGAGARYKRQAQAPGANGERERQARARMAGSSAGVEHDHRAQTAGSSAGVNVGIVRWAARLRRVRSQASAPPTARPDNPNAAPALLPNANARVMMRVRAPSASNRRGHGHELEQQAGAQDAEGGRRARAAARNFSHFPTCALL